VSFIFGVRWDLITLSTARLHHRRSPSASAVRPDLSVLPKGTWQDSQARRCFVSGRLPEMRSDWAEAREPPGSAQGVEWQTRRLDADIAPAISRDAAFSATDIPVKRRSK